MENLWMPPLAMASPLLGPNRAFQHLQQGGGWPQAQCSAAAQSLLQRSSPSPNEIFTYRPMEKLISLLYNRSTYNAPEYMDYKHLPLAIHNKTFE